MASNATSNQDQSQVLDLVDMALLLNYERTSTDPRFRGATLHEIVYPGKTSVSSTYAPFKTKDNEHHFVFTKSAGTQTAQTVPSTPFNMVPENTPANSPLRFLTPKQLETAFHRARNHDGCFMMAIIIQNFLDLFPPSTKLRVRHGQTDKGPATTYTTDISTFRIVESTFLGPRQMTKITFLPDGPTYINGDEAKMDHAVVAFAPAGATNLTSFLDLSSMQFGDLGRGPGKKGQSLFALDTFDEFYDRMDSVFHTNAEDGGKVSSRIGAHPTMDEWTRDVAARAKKRWQARDTEKWCGHCGAPVSDDKKCGGCKKESYCCRDHQKMAWPFHKHYCKKD